MNTSYTDRFRPYWSTNTTEFQQSPLMQTIPKPISTLHYQAANLPSSALLKHYNNSSNIEISSVFNGLRSQNDRHCKSAFKPVVKKTCCTTTTVSSTTMKMFPFEQNYYSSASNLVSLNTLTSSKNYYAKNNQSQIPMRCVLNRKSQGLTNTTTTEVRQSIPSTNTTFNSANLQKIEMSTKQQQSEFTSDQALAKKAVDSKQIKSDNFIKPSYQWNKLLQLCPEIKKHPNTSSINLPTRKRQPESSDTQNSIDVKKRNVEVIDLTSNDDVEVDKGKSTFFSNETLQSNENNKQFPKTTEVETKKDIEVNKSMEKQPDKRSKLTQLALQSTLNSMPPSSVAKSPNPLLMPNLTQNAFKKPPKEQLKSISKYNQSMQYFRGYNNGFRLFAERNYLKAQAYALQNGGKSFVHNTLLNWWTKLSGIEKEQYSKYGGMLRVKSLNSLQNNSRNGMFCQKPVLSTQSNLINKSISIVNVEKAIRTFEDRFKLVKND